MVRWSWSLSNDKDFVAVAWEHGHILQYQDIRSLANDIAPYYNIKSIMAEVQEVAANCT